MTTDKIMGTVIAAGIDDANLGKLVRYLHTNPVADGAAQSTADATDATPVAQKKAGSRCNPANGLYITSAKMRPYFNLLRSEALKKPINGTIVTVAGIAGWTTRRSGLAAALVEAERRGNDLIRVTPQWPDPNDRHHKTYVIEAIQ
jgi:hypothetical protein